MVVDKFSFKCSKDVLKEVEMKVIWRPNLCLEVIDAFL